jgi:hypothetical protein
MKERIFATTPYLDPRIIDWNWPGLPRYLAQQMTLLPGSRSNKLAFFILLIAIGEGHCVIVHGNVRPVLVVRQADIRMSPNRA